MINEDIKKIDDSFTKKEKIVKIVSALILGIIFYKFTCSASIGISAFIFTFIFTAFFLYNNRKKIKITASGMFSAACALILSANYSIHANLTFYVLNILAITVLMIFATMQFCAYEVHFDSLNYIFKMFQRIFSLTFVNFLKPLYFIKSLHAHSEVQNSQRKNIAAGLIISIPVLFVVLKLLSDSDMVFGYYMSNMFNFINYTTVTHEISKIIYIIIVSVYIFAYTLSFQYPYKNIDKSKTLTVNSTFTASAIIPINIVYLIFSIVQFSYLYGGNRALPDGFTYAEYARRGFFELVAVTVINFSIILFVIAKTNRNKFLNILLSIMIAFTFNMLFSANFKLSLYEKSFGFTYLRIYVHAFILLLFAMTLFALAGIWSNKLNIIKCCLTAAVVFYVILNFANIDKMIVNKNVARYHETGKIDVDYILTISEDALPDIISFASNSKTETDVSEKIKPGLSARKKSLNYEMMNLRQNWYEFNYSKYRAHILLKDF